MLQWIENSLYSFSYLPCDGRLEPIEINVTELFNSNSNTWKEELKKHKTKKPFKMKSEASTNIFFPCSQKSNYQNCSEYVANYSAP